MYGLAVTASRPAMIAPEMARITVAMEPERMKEMTRKQRKNTSAVPKSPIRASASTHMAEKAMKEYRFRSRNRCSSVAAPT